jgi:hypothetical protein
LAGPSAAVCESEITSVLDGDEPDPSLLRQLAPALGLHPSDVFVIAGQRVPDDLAPLDATAASGIGRLAWSLTEGQHSPRTRRSGHPLMASTSDSAVQTMGDLQADIKRITSIERMVDHDVDQDADVRAGHRSAQTEYVSLVGNDVLVTSLRILRHEFDHDPGTFTLGLREARWDREAFTRLERAMRDVCTTQADQPALDRWLAWGFYHYAWWIPAQARYEPFRQRHGGGYYDACLTRVSDLADWFFQGHHNYIEPHFWTDL